MVAGRAKEAGPSRVGAEEGSTAGSLRSRVGGTRSCLVEKLECLEDGGGERKGRKKRQGLQGG